MELSDKEKDVLIEIAENGPMSGYDFHLGGRRQRGDRESIMSSSYWIKVQKKLLDQGLITLFSRKGKGTKFEDRRGRVKKLYFLTEGGAIGAMSYGADLNLLTKNLRHFKDEEERSKIKVWIEECKLLGEQRMKAVYELLTANKINEIQPLELEQARKILEILLKHPQYGGKFRWALKKVNEVLENGE